LILAATTDALPTNGGAVAAAYLVFLGLVVLYLAIMAFKMANLQRDVADLIDLTDRQASEPAASPPETEVVS
jgi:hypothetical protein